jgi:hypothetical protein
MIMMDRLGLKPKSLGLVVQAFKVLGKESICMATE